MDRNQFIGRSELLVWINNLLKLKLEKIEDCCNGVVYLQLMDVLHPGTVPLTKIKWNSSLEYEHVHNYKILQNVFRRCNISKDINVERLIKGRYIDNLEFLQWMKSYADKIHEFDTKYDPIYTRVYCVLKSCPQNTSNIIAYVKNILPKWAIVNEMTNEYIMNINNSFTKLQKLSQTDSISNTDKLQPNINGTNVQLIKSNGSTNKRSNDSIVTTVDELKLEIESLNKKVKDLQMEKQVAKMSKDFYYNKLRQIEILCQNNSNKSINVQTLLDIMYQKDK